jgi:hypothetical protein
VGARLAGCAIAQDIANHADSLLSGAAKPMHRSGRQTRSSPVFLGCPFSRFCSGNPAVMGRRAPFRPETLRPQLWLGLPLYRTVLRHCHYTVVIPCVKFKFGTAAGEGSACCDLYADPGGSVRGCRDRPAAWGRGSACRYNPCRTPARRLSGRGSDWRCQRLSSCTTA